MRISKQEIWRKHVTQGLAYPDGTSAYCRDHGLKKSAFGYWRQKFLGVRTAKPPKGSLEVSPFVPVVIEDPQSFELPDPKWLGRFAVELIRGLR